MTLRTKFLFLASALLIACGSEESAQHTPDLPPGIEQPTPPTPPAPPGTNKVDPTDQLPVDPVGTDGGTTDPTDGGTTDPDPTDGGLTDPDPTDGGTTDPGDGGSTDPTDPPTDGGGGEQDAGPVTPPPPPTSATVGGVKIDFVSQEGNTFCYQVTELEGAKDLSHWDLGTNCTVLSGTTEILVPVVVDGVETQVNVIESFEIGTDPKSGVKGGKWNVSDLFSTGLFCITVDGLPTLSQGEVQVASKSGLPISHGAIVGPVCQ